MIFLPFAPLGAKESLNLFLQYMLIFYYENELEYGICQLWGNLCISE